MLLLILIKEFWCFQNLKLKIGRRFANRYHTTVIHAVKTIKRLSEKDDEMKRNISHIRGLILEE